MFKKHSFQRFGFFRIFFNFVCLQISLDLEQLYVLFYNNLFYMFFS